MRNRPDWLGGVVLTSLASAGGNRPCQQQARDQDKPDWSGVHVDQTGERWVLTGTDWVVLT